MFAHVASRLKDINLRISQAAAKAGRDPADVKLVAVSKTFPPDAVLAAYNAGHRLFGENRVQELAAKVPMLPADIRWHLIGHLQGNKASAAIRLAGMIESVDSVKLMERLNRIAVESGIARDILMEINISGEDSKQGAPPAQAVALAEKALELPGLRLLGMMTMAPFGAEDCELRRVFSGLRQLRDCISEKCNIPLPELSMGMSGDFEAAIQEGATIVRIGSAIFGCR